MSAERDARKKTLENRIRLYHEMELLCYTERCKLDKELQFILDAEATEDEQRWAARQYAESRRFIHEQRR